MFDKEGYLTRAVLIAAISAMVTPLDAHGSNMQDDAGLPATSNAAGRQAATTQIQAPERSSYVPDQIHSDGRTSDAEVRATADRRSAADDLTDDLRGHAAVPRRPMQANAFEQFVSRVADVPLRRFGSNLLVPDARDFTAPPTTAIPADYRINPGDELMVGLTGSLQSDNLRLVVDSEGRVFLPRVGAITVGGMRYGDLQSIVAAQVARQYRGFRAAVTVGRLHGITVYVTGFAQTPGSYTVSSLSTLVNAVLAAGGPSAGGSFRTIELRRSGRIVAQFDLYDLLLRGDKSSDALLQSGDVIYIAPIGPQVAVIGSVNNQSIFETRPRDTLADVLAYAGGIDTVADDSRLLVLDPLRVDRGWQQLPIQQAREQLVTRAQILRVLSSVGIAQPISKQAVLVTVNGEVAKPGRYYVPPGTSLGQAMALAGGLTAEAYSFGAVFTREALRLQQRESFERAIRDVELALIAEPLTSTLRSSGDAAQRVAILRALTDQLEQRQPDGRLVLGTPPDATTIRGDITLQNNDTLYVPSIPITVGVFGSVPNPASFGYEPRKTVGDYIAQAGGVQRIGDRRQIFVVRANGQVLANGGAVAGKAVLGKHALPGDLIYVPINGSRGEIWLKLGALTQGLFTTAITAASVTAISK